jgi:peptide/nickel transport system permease protein
VLLRLAPGDPLTLAAAQQGALDAPARQALRARQGLDEPVARQYARFVRGALRGDLGTSLAEGRPVGALLRPALARSALLSGAGLALAVVLGVGVGSLQGWRPGGLAGRVLGNGLTGLYAVPEFVLAVALSGLLAARLRLFPTGGLADPVLSLVGTPGEQLADRAWHLVLPALTLALGWGAAIARQQRVALLEVAADDFVRTARAKGLADRAVFGRHAFRAALPGTVAVVGLMLPVLVGGAVVVEALYSWPGMGSLLLQAVLLRDYPVVSGALVVVGAAVTLASLLTDLVVAWLDPRRRADAA